MSSSSTTFGLKTGCVMFSQPAARCMPKAQAQPCSTQILHVFSPGCPGIALQVERRFFLLIRPHQWSRHSRNYYTCHKHVQAAIAATACAHTSTSLCNLALVDRLLDSGLSSVVRTCHTKRLASGVTTHAQAAATSALALRWCRGRWRAPRRPSHQKVALPCVAHDVQLPRIMSYFTALCTRLRQHCDDCDEVSTACRMPQCSRPENHTMKQREKVLPHAGGRCQQDIKGIAAATYQ